MQDSRARGSLAITNLLGGHRQLAPTHTPPAHTAPAHSADAADADNAADEQRACRQMRLPLVSCVGTSQVPCVPPALTALELGLRFGPGDFTSGSSPKEGEVETALADGLTPTSAD